MSTLIPRLLVTLSLVACSRSPTTHTTSEPARPAPGGEMRDGPQAPITIAIDVMKGAPAAGATLALRAHVSHPSTWTAPLDLEIRLPPGVTLVSSSGGQRFTLTPSSGRDVEDVDFEIQLSGPVPLADIVVVAAHQSKQAGVHAEGHYRFGRPEPLPHVPARTGPEVTTNKGSLGRAVPLDPSSN